MQTITAFFNDRVKRFSSCPLLRMRPRWRTIRWTYQELAHFAGGVASLLEKNDVKVQDRVLLIGTNSPYWVGTFFGIFLRGGVVVPLNPQSSPAFIKKVIAETKPKILCHSSDVTLAGVSDIPMIPIDTLGSFARKPSSYTLLMSQPSDIAEIVYTSGTTGEPKGVVLTHKNIMVNVAALLQVIQISAHDRVVSVLPLFHMYEQTAGLLIPLALGMEIMYAPAVSSRAISECLQVHKASTMLVVPELLETMLHRIEDRARQAGKEASLARLFTLATYLPMWLRRILFRKVHKKLGGSLRFMTTGGAPLASDIQQKWHAMGVTILQGYGLTETSPVATSNSEQVMKLGSVGKALPGVKVKIADDGEILIKGQNVFSGYYRNEAKTREVFDEEGWFKTDDLGYFDHDGFLFIHGRKKYVIVTPSGENVFPEDIETELKKITGVADSAVIGIKHNGREIIHAVLLGDFKDASEVVVQANTNLAPYQRIQDWSVWPDADFPRSATRKVKKEEVITWVEAERERKVPLPSVAARSPLMRLVSSVTGLSLSRVHDDSNLIRDLHLDSLMRIELVSRVEELFDVEISEQDITHQITIKRLQKMIDFGKQKRPTQRRRRKWLLSLPARVLRMFVQRMLVFPIYWFFIDLKVEGLEHLDETELPAIFMVNHLTYADVVIVLKALPPRIRRKIAVGAAIDVLYNLYWYVAWLIEVVFNSYPFPRREEESIKPGLQSTGELLDKGFSILIFPEGKVSVSGKLLPLKRGAGLLATEMEAPVVPVVIKGIRDVVPMYKLLPRKKGAIVVRFGKPLRFSLQDSYIDATKKIHQAMLDIIEDRR